jgi:hypothetical protein
MRKMLVSLFLVCMCALSFMASAEVFTDQSACYDTVSVDVVGVAPQATVDAVVIEGTRQSENELFDPEKIETVNFYGETLEADAPERYDKATVSI